MNDDVEELRAKASFIHNGFLMSLMENPPEALEKAEKETQDAVFAVLKAHTPEINCGARIMVVLVAAASVIVQEMGVEGVDNIAFRLAVALELDRLMQLAGQAVDTRKTRAPLPETSSILEEVERLLREQPEA